MKTELVTTPCENSYIVLVAFERQLSDDLEVMEENFRTGKITANPATDFNLAAQQQLSLELQTAHNEGMAGFHQCLETRQQLAFDTKAMNWTKTTRT